MSDDQAIQEQEKGLWERFTDAASDLGNKGLLVREGAQQFVASIPAIPGYLVDLVDMGSEKIIGVDLYEGSAGSYIQGKAKGLIDITDPVKWAGGTPEIKTETDQKIVDYTETTLDVASVVVSLGAATPKLAATGSKILAKTSDDIAKAVARTASHTVDDAAKAAARTASHTVDDAAEAAAKSSSFWKGAVTRRTAFTLAVAPPVLYATAGIIEVETGGKLSRAALETSISTIKSGLESGVISYENLEDSINATSYGFEVLNALDKSLQNSAVLAAMGTLSDTPTEEQIQRGRQAAVGWLLTPQNLPVLAGKNLLRISIIDEVIDDKEQADKYLAEQFMNDIYEKAQVEALEGHQITEDDIKTKLAHALQNPVAKTMFPDRLENGLKQLYPEMFTATVAEASTEQKQTQTQTQETAQRAAVQQTAENPSVWASLMNSDISQMGRGLLSTTFDNVRDQVSESNDWSLKMKFAWANIVIGFTSLLSGLPIIGEWAQKWGDEYKRELLTDAKNRLQDMANGDVIGQGSNLMGLVRDITGFGPEEKPTGPTAQNRPDLALN